MPLTEKGRKIKRSMHKTYGSKKKADQVFFASRNAGTISGVDNVRGMRHRASQRRMTGY